jgi:hypothetical protein
MTEIKSEYRCDTCQNDDCDLSNVSFEKAKKDHILDIGRIMVMRCTTEIHGCLSHSAIAKPLLRWKIIESVPDKNNVILLGIRESPDGDFSTRDDALAAINYAHSAGGSRQQDPSYQDLVDHIRWTQNLWRHGIEIMRKNNLVIASDTPMEKLAFTFYMDLCEIDWRAQHLFGEGPGDENYKDQSAIRAREIVPYPRPYEERIKEVALIEIREDIMQYVRKHEWISSEYNNQMHVLTVRPFERFLESLRHATGGPCNKVEADKGVSDND